MEFTAVWNQLQPRLRQQIDAGLHPQTIAEFCETRSITVLRWLSGSQLPTGGKFIKLWHLLAAAGSDSPELGELPPLNFFVAELYAYSVIDLDEVMTVLNVSKTQNAFKALRGRVRLEPQQPLAQLQDKYDAELAAAKTSLRRRLGSTVFPNQLEPGPVTPEPVSEPPELSPTETIHVLADLLTSALPLARALNSDAFTPEDRSLLRRLTGGDGVFELSNVLNALCSERARSHGR